MMEKILIRHDDMLKEQGNLIAQVDSSSRPAHHRLTELNESDIRIEGKIDVITKEMKDIKLSMVGSMMETQKHTRMGLRLSLASVIIVSILTIVLLRQQAVSTTEVLDAVKAGTTAATLII